MCPNEPNFLGWVLAPLRVLADADPNELLIGVRAAAARSRQDLYDRLAEQCRFRFSLREGKFKPW